MSAIDVFNDNLRDVKDMVGLYRALQQHTSPALDMSHILRASLVFAVGALDNYIHNRVIELVCAQFVVGNPPLAPAMLALPVRFDSLMSYQATADKQEWLHQLLEETLGWRSFQQPERIADAFKLARDGNIWDEASRELGAPREELLARLKAIVERRNKIAHEGDRYRGARGNTARTLIDVPYVEQSIAFMESLVTSIDRCTG